MPEIKHTRPPNFAKIVEVFPLARGPLVIFAYAPYIYVPNGKPLLTSLIAHETIHVKRQKKMGVELWWDTYLTSPKFRWEEEVLAHRAEYDSLAAMAWSDRARMKALKTVARKLAAPLYGRMVTVTEALQLLTCEEKHVD